MTGFSISMDLAPKQSKTQDSSTLKSTAESRLKNFMQEVTGRALVMMESATQYEANPMSMLIEQAGGASTTGRVRILDIQPTDLHQRVPVIIGSKNEVDLVTGYHN